MICSDTLLDSLHRGSYDELTFFTTPHASSIIPAVLFMFFHFITKGNHYLSSPRLAVRVIHLEFGFDSTQQTPQCSTYVYCSSPSRQPSRPPFVSLNTAPGPSFLQPKSQVWADCTSPILFSVSYDFAFPSYPSSWANRKREAKHIDLEGFADSNYQLR